MIKSENSSANCARCLLNVEGDIKRPVPRGHAESLAFDLSHELMPSHDQRELLVTAKSIAASPFHDWDSSVLTKFSNVALALIFPNVGAIQLTEGCTVGCNFCGNGAKKGISNKITPEDIVRMASRYPEELKANRPFLYYASDPLDYKSEVSLSREAVNYGAVHRLWNKITGYSPYVSTAVPKGTEESALEGTTEGWLSRVSISYMNKKRLAESLPDFVDKERRSQSYPNVFFYDVEVDPRLSNVTKDNLRLKNPVREERVSGIGCFDAVLLTPLGVFNIVQAIHTKELTQGQYQVEVDPERLKDPLPTSSLPIANLLTQVVVNRESRLLGRSGGIMDVMQRVFHGEQPFMGNVISVSNLKGETGYYAINVLNHIASPCSKVDFELTRTPLLHLMMLLSSRKAFYFAEAIPGNREMRKLAGLDLGQASEFIDRSFVEELITDMKQFLSLRQAVKGIHPLDEEETLAGRQKWESVMGVGGIMDFDSFCKGVSQRYRDLGL